MEIDWNAIGYCPWCGAERTIEAYQPGASTLEWEACKTPLCAGTLVAIVTDMHGYIIHPRHQKGKYMYSPPYNVYKKRTLK